MTGRQDDRQRILDEYMIRLVGFGRACAPVRCAHPSFWAHKHAKRALRAPHRSFAASLKIKINYFQKQNAALQIQTQPARGVYISSVPLDHRGFEI